MGTERIEVYIHKDGAEHLARKSGAPASIYDNPFPFGTNARPCVLLIGSGEQPPVVFTESEVRVIRHNALVEAAKAVCGYCGGRFYPEDGPSRKAQGPNTAGNYTHRVMGDDVLCPCTAIWARINYEKSTL